VPASVLSERGTGSVDWGRKFQALVPRTPEGVDWKRASFRVLRVAPWIAFGPITGVLTERAIACNARGERVLAGMYVILNISILIALPTVTAGLAARL
jgi:hypothetical protein